MMKITISREESGADIRSVTTYRNLCRFDCRFGFRFDRHFDDVIGAVFCVPSGCRWRSCNHSRNHGHNRNGELREFKMKRYIIYGCI